MNKKRKRNLMLLLILVLFVSVGYALLSTTLNINGTSKINDAKWDIHWENPIVTDGSVTSTLPTIDSLKTTATFDITLTTPGDFYEFTIDAKNDGTIDGMISDIKMLYNDAEVSATNALPAYLNYTVKYSDGKEVGLKHLLKATEKETYKVRVEYKKDIENSELPGTDVTLSLKYKVTYIQADSTAENRNGVIKMKTRQVAGQITPGDEVTIGETEDFYVISSDSEKTVLLAKYNLLVGNESNDGGSSVTPMDKTNTSGYGLQSINATGFTGGNSFKGTVAFSGTTYWDDGGLLSPYDADGASYNGSPYPSVYNNLFTTEPDFENDGFSTLGYSIAYYVELYKTKLIGMGAPSTIKGRLLTYEEADASKEIKDNGTLIVLDKHQSYWLESAGNDAAIWNVRSNGTFSFNYYHEDSVYGVRPVIEIPTSLLS